MSPTLSIVLLWIGFAASHLTLSHPPIRSKLVAALGEKPFQGVYSLLAFVFFVPLCWVYFHHLHEGDWLFVLPRGEWLVWIVSIGSTLGFVLMVGGLVQPNPASMAGGAMQACGVLRITRHPLFMGLGIVGIFHLLANTSSTDVAFFAGLPIFAIVGCAHQDRRKLAEGLPGYASFVAETPFLPFTGKETLRGVSEMGPLRIGAGIAVAIGVRYVHHLSALVG